MKKFDKSTNPASETIFFQMIFCGIRQHILFWHNFSAQSSCMLRLLLL